MVQVKICGITSAQDGLAAASLGADMIGLVFAPSPRRVSPDRARQIVLALPPRIKCVGVFVDAPVAQVRELRDYCGLDLVQLHGAESEAEAASLGRGVIKALRVSTENGFDARAYVGATLLLDTHVPGSLGGTGQTFDWSLAVEAARRRSIILAGGLNPDNVASAIETVNPHAVDVSSGVESEPGRKDHDRIASFIRRAKAVAVSAR